MTKKAWQKARYGYRLFRFILSSGTRYQVHSPTLYAFINGVIRSNGKIEKQDDIEKIRQECLQSREIILKTDYGSGADALQKTEYPIEIKEIAKRSLSSARHARRLSLLVKYMDAKKILEIGTSLGIST